MIFELSLITPTTRARLAAARHVGALRRRVSLHPSQCVCHLHPSHSHCSRSCAVTVCACVALSLLRDQRCHATAQRDKHARTTPRHHDTTVLTHAQATRGARIRTHGSRRSAADSPHAHSAAKSAILPTSATALAGAFARRRRRRILPIDDTGHGVRGERAYCGSARTRARRQRDGRCAGVMRQRSVTNTHARHDRRWSRATRELHITSMFLRAVRTARDGCL